MQNVIISSRFSRYIHRGTSIFHIAYLNNVVVNCMCYRAGVQMKGRLTRTSPRQARQSLMAVTHLWADDISFMICVIFKDDNNIHHKLSIAVFYSILLIFRCIFSFLSIREMWFGFLTAFRIYLKGISIIIKDATLIYTNIYHGQCNMLFFCKIGGFLTKE